MGSQPAHPLLDGRTSRWTAILLASCTVMLAVLGALVAHQSRVDGLDQAIDFWIVRWASGHENLLLLTAALPTAIPAGGASLIMVAACLMTGRLKGAILAATAVPVASALCDALLKPLVHRGDLAYPSGHVTSIVALASMLTVLLVLPPRPLVGGPTRLLVPAAAGLAACGVAVAVISLRWHYFTDTIGGAALGTGTVCALALLLDRPIVTRWLQTPASWLLSNGSDRRNVDIAGGDRARDPRLNAARRLFAWRGNRRALTFAQTGGSCAGATLLVARPEVRHDDVSAPGCELRLGRPASARTGRGHATALTRGRCPGSCPGSAAGSALLPGPGQPRQITCAQSPQISSSQLAGFSARTWPDFYHDPGVPWIASR